MINNKDIEMEKIAQNIRDAIKNYQIKNELTFQEDSHTYFIKNKENNIISDMPSVSTVVESFFEPFKPETTKAFKNCFGNKDKETALLNEWAATGEYAANKGSRVHYILEKNLINSYNNFKTIRKPIFSCDDVQIKEGNNMIKAGGDFINLMHQRGAIMLDTEIILGNEELGFFGQPDNVWLMRNKENKIGMVMTDWKTNKPKNFKTQSYTKKMKYPFNEYDSTALGHYYIQLPLYTKLLLKMLENTSCENIPMFGGVVVLLKKDKTFEEYKVPQFFFNTIKNLTIKNYIF